MISVYIFDGKMRKFLASLQILLLLTETLFVPFLVTPAYATNNVTQTGYFNAGTAIDYTYNSNYVSVDSNGAHPVTGINKITNPSFTSNNSSWSLAAIAPTGYVEVPGDSNYSTQNFLVMQYEAKYDCTATPDGDGDAPATCGALADSNGGFDYRDVTFSNSRVVSSANGGPIVHITQAQALSACPTNSHLITNNEWMTIARNAEAQTANWADGVIGSTVSSSGGLKRGNSGIVDSATYDGSDPEYGTGRNSKAMVTLSNGSTVWDMAGNVWEWTNNSLQRKQSPIAWNGTTDLVSGGYTFVDFTNGGGLTNYIHSYRVGSPLQIDDLQPSNHSYNASQGVGRIFQWSDPSDTDTTSLVYARGGRWANGAGSGLFSLNLGNPNSYQDFAVGYRCATGSLGISQTQSSTGGHFGGNNTVVVGSIADAKLYQSVNVGDTSTYDFSIYVYDTTSGNDGSTVDGTVATLWYNGATISTTYTNAGSGWWKLSGTLTGANASREYGLQVKTGKTIKVDDVTLSKQGTFTIYNTSAYQNSNLQRWESFSDSVSASNNAAVVYQLCTDDGSTCENGSGWKYWNGSSWQTASNTTTHVNTAAQLTATAMQALSITSKKISVKAIMLFAGADTPQLNSISIGLTADSAAPSVSITPVSPNPTSDNTPTIIGTATDDQGTISAVEFQMDSTAGSWTSCSADDGGFDEVSETFTCQISAALSNASHIIYVRSTDSYNHTTTVGSESSATFTVDTSLANGPDAPELSSPNNNDYTSSDRPIFRWKAADNLSSYRFEIDNGDKDDFGISDIPTSRTSDLETNTYIVHYENFNDTDSTNNFISIQTKSSSDWGSDHNDGKIKEGKRTWKVLAVDGNGKTTTSSRDIFVDFTKPGTELTQINNVPITNNSVSTTSKTPTLYGTIIDTLATGNSSGPKSVEIKIEKKNTNGTYTLNSLANISPNEMYWTSDKSKIQDNTEQKSDKYSPFEFTPTAPLPTGEYKITITGKDTAGNSNEKVVTLTVGSFSQVATPAQQKIADKEINNVIPEAPNELKNAIKDQLVVTKPVEQPQAPEQKEQKPGSFTKLSQFLGNVGDYFGGVFTQGGQAFSAGIEHPKQFANRVGGWLSYTITSFGEIVLDGSPTQISDVKVEQSTTTTAIITWKTNHLANSKVNFGVTKDYGQDVQSSEKVHDHRLEITGLKPGVTYHYEVMSQNKNYVYDADHEFVTPAQ